jgi:hypothetical protein
MLPGVTAATSRDLCPGLVVPHGNECLLAVPILETPRFQAMDVATLNVQDMQGKTIIQAEVVMSRMSSGSGMQHRPLVVLRAGTELRIGNQSLPLLAYCKGFHEGTSLNYVYIYDSRDELFAQIQKNSENSYVLTNNRSGSQLFFRGNFKGHSTNVTNAQQHVLAETAPAVMPFDAYGSYYKLRVTAYVDVGLILCALLSVNTMDRQVR